MRSVMEFIFFRGGSSLLLCCRRAACAASNATPPSSPSLSSSSVFLYLLWGREESCALPFCHHSAQVLVLFLKLLCPQAAPRNVPTPRTHTHTQAYSTVWTHTKMYTHRRTSFLEFLRLLAAVRLFSSPLSLSSSSLISHLIRELQSENILCWWADCVSV